MREDQRPAIRRESVAKILSSRRGKTAREKRVDARVVNATGNDIGADIQVSFARLSSVVESAAEKRLGRRARAVAAATA